MINAQTLTDHTEAKTMEIYSKQLLEAINVVNTVIDHKHYAQPFRAIRIERKNNITTLSASNGETEIETVVNCHCEINVAINARDFFNAVKNIKKLSKTVKLTDSGKILTVAGEGMTYGLDTIPLEDFPQSMERSITDSDMGQSVIYERNKLIGALEFASPAVSREGRLGLCGVNFFDDRLITVDGHRMHIEKNLPNVMGKHSIPLIAAKAICAMPDDKAIQATFYDSCAIFSTGYTVVKTKYTDVLTAPVDQVIPSGDPIATVTAKKDDLLRVVKNCIPVSKDRKEGMLLSAGELGLVVKRGAYSEKIQAWNLEFKEFKEFDIYLNPIYFSELLEGVTLSGVNVEFYGKRGPIKIVDGNRLGIVMPMAQK